MSKTDFEKRGEMIKSLKTERNSLKDQVRNLETLLEVQKKFIDKIEKLETSKDDNGKFKGLFKNLFYIFLPSSSNHVNLVIKGKDLSRF